MPKDLKYGEVKLSNQRSLKDDEPVFVLAAHDPIAIGILETYRMIANARSAPTQHVERVQAAIEEFHVWQDANGTREPSAE